MAKAKDMSNQKFGRLTVIERAGSSSCGNVKWLCKCDCGNTHIAKGSDLRNGSTKSCGCLHKEIASELSYKDIKGQKFTRLTVIEEKGKNKYGSYMWLCKCDCGNEIVVDGASLRNSHTKSCGCYNKDVASKNMKKQIEKLWQDEDYRERKSERMTELNNQWWQDEDYRESMSGEHNHSWKGGITPISYHLRKHTKQWDRDVRQAYNKKCALTGVKCTTTNSAVHHLYGFNMIVEQAHTINNIEVKPQVKDYTKEELQLLENYVLEWHKDTSNGILLSNEVHKLFHNIYNRGDNTPQQFEEFKARYLNHEFDNELN